MEQFHQLDCESDVYLCSGSFEIFWRHHHCYNSVVNFRRRWCTFALVHNTLTLFKAGCRGLAMVLIAAAVCNKTGKAIISRQFVELTKSRIEVWSKSWPRQPLWTSPFFLRDSSLPSQSWWQQGSSTPSWRRTASAMSTSLWTACIYSLSPPRLL